MTTEEKLDKLEEGFHNIDKRQETFETYTRERIDSFEKFVKGYIDNNEVKLTQFNQRMDRMETKLDNLSAQMHNLTIASTVGIAAIVVAIVLSR